MDVVGVKLEGRVSMELRYLFEAFLPNICWFLNAPLCLFLQRSLFFLIL